MSAYRHAANHQHFTHTRDAVAVHRYTFIRSGVIGGYRNRRSAPKIAHVVGELEHLFSQQNGVATSGQILTYLSRYEYELAVKTGSLERILLGIYCRCEPTNELRLRGLDLSCGSLVPVCLASAVALFGFDTEDPPYLHVLNPPGHQLRPATSPPSRPWSWPALSVARGHWQPLDAALRSGTCSRGEMWHAATQQAGRRGIVAVRDLLPLADGGLLIPGLQYEIVDGNGELRRVDFAWPQYRAAVEYEGLDWHSGPDAIRRDRKRQVALQDVDWVVIPIVFEDVRYRAWDFVARINQQLHRRDAA